MPLHAEKNKSTFENNYLIPGKPLTPEQLTNLIESSRNSGTISMQDAYKKIRNSFPKK